MKRFKFVAAVASLTLFIILVSVILLLRKIGTSSLPRQDGKLELAGLGANVKILRDSLGVPYIVAKSDSDAYYALGFVHAQDRLFQMEMYRRLGEGKLSEILGGKTLAIDELFRTLRFTQMADSLYRDSSPLSKDILRWYSKGVNAYIRNAKAMPAEFAMLQFSPAPWRPRDCYIVARLMAWELNISWWTKPVFGELYDSLGAKKASLLIPLFSGREDRQAHGEKTRISPELKGFSEANSQAMAMFEGVRAPDCFGSNNWTISPRRTNDGAAILCNDPHLAFTQPAKWYFVDISAPSLHAMGASLPGTPGIVIGRNEDIAWGMTNVMADDSDFYIMQTDSANQNEYWYNGKLLPFITTDDTIEMKDSTPYIFVRRMTVLGPVVSGVVSGSYKMTPLHSEEAGPRHIVVLRWAAYWPSDEVRSIYLLNTADNFQKFIAALKYFGAPAQNFVYADVRGNIGYKVAGNIPLRRYPLPFLPQNGNSGANVWTSFIPFNRLPVSYDPSRGYYATANNRTTPESYPYYITDLYEPPSRIDRINSFITTHDTMSVQLSHKLQLDYYSDFMVLLDKRILNACKVEKYFPKELVYLENFEGMITAKSVASTILNVSFVNLVHNIFEPLMGKSLFKRYALISNVPTRILKNFLDNPRELSELYDVANGDSLLDMELVRGLEMSLDQLRARFGPRPIDWMWGNLHTLELKHLLSSNSVIRRIYDLGPFPRGGTNTTVNNGEYSLDRPYDMLIGPSMRMIVDMGKPGMYFSLPGGECGQVLSSHYSDFLDDYLKGEIKFFPIKLPESETVHHLLLLPRK